MRFSYTDDAIVSTSATGRHLSTVIRRPVVLMSGWAEHAEQVCQVLNSLQPDHPVGRGLTDGDGEPYVADFTPKKFTVRATVGGVQHFQSLTGDEAAPLLMQALKESQAAISQMSNRAAELRKQLKTWQDYGHAVHENAQQFAEQNRQLRELIELGSEHLAALASLKPGHLITINCRTFKRV